MRIALVGLAASEVLIVKNYIKKYAEELDISWVGISEKNYDVLIVRARFIETPEVEKLIDNSAEHIVILSVYRDDKFGSDSIRRDIPALKLPSYDKEDIVEWISYIKTPASRVSRNDKRELEQILADNKNEISLQIKANSHYDEDQESISDSKRKKALEKGLAKLTRIGAKLSTGENQQNQNSFDGAVKSSAKNHHARKALPPFKNMGILKAIRDSVDLKVIANEVKAWIKTDQRRVMTNSALEFIPKFNELEWQEYRFSSVPEQAQFQVELNQWLWESLWKSDIDFSQYTDDTSLYQLKRWPQPKSRLHRNEPLRISAYIQKRAMNINEISELTSIEKSLVQKFVYTMQVVGFVKKIKAADKPEKSLNSFEDSQSKATKLSFVKRIRNRLGLNGTK